jgi:hypothetical protein
MSEQATVIPIYKDYKKGLARISTERNEPDLLLSLAAAGDMLCRPGEPANNDGCRRRRELLGLLGVGSRKLVTLRQVHSRRTFWTDEIGGPDTEGDGLLTAEQLELPAVTVADCMPIYLFAAGTPLRGILHSGWKGTGIAAEAVGRIRERFNLGPEDITAVLGPAIGGCCYRVDETRAREFSSSWGSDAVRYRDGEAYLDLRAANTALLRRMGVRDLRAVDECTVCGGGYGSFRREGPQNFTHMLAMISNFPVD